MNAEPPEDPWQREPFRLWCEKSLLVDVGSLAIQSMAVLMCSKTAAQEAVVYEVLKKYHPVGGDLPDALKMVLWRVTGTTGRQLKGMIQRFEKENPQYVDGRPQCHPNVRKLPIRKAKTVLGASMAKHSYKLPVGVAKGLRANFQRAERQALTIARTHDPRFPRSEVRKFMVGQIVASQSDNLSNAARSFNGERLKVLQDSV